MSYESLSTSSRFPDTFLITVGDPEKHGEGVNAYTTYQVSTKTTIASFQQPDFFVRRRFSDFLWLRQALADKYPDCIVPALPEKKKMNYLERFSVEFVETRRDALETFMFRLTMHPRLRLAPDFHKFIEAKSWALETAMAGGQSTFGKMFKNLSKDTDEMLTKWKRPAGVDEQEEVFENLRNYVAKLEEQLDKVHTNTKVIATKRSQTGSDLGEFGPSLNLLAQTETDLSDALTKFGQATDLIAQQYTSQAEKDLLSLKRPIKEYILMCTSVKEMLRNREHALFKYVNLMTQQEANQKELARLRECMANPGKKSALSGFMGKFSDETDADKAKKVEDKIAEMEASISSTRKDVNDFSEHCLDEMKRFHALKLQDFKSMMLNYVSQQADFHRKLSETWASLLPHVENAGGEASGSRSGSDVAPIDRGLDEVNLN